MTKAQKYIQDRKPDIEISLDEDGRLHELENLLISLNETIELLKPLRLNDNATTLKLNEIFNTKRNIVFTSWLIKALSYDKSFIYAYNYLAQKRNRENGSVVYPVIIPVDYNEIESLVSNDKRKNKNNSKQKTFNCKLNSIQVEILAQHLNQAGLFVKKIDATILQSVFDCTLNEPLRIKNNRLLAYLFTMLYKDMFITRTWQSISHKNNLFLSENDKYLTNGDLSSAKYDNEICNPKGSILIDSALKEIKKV